MATKILGETRGVTAQPGSAPLVPPSQRAAEGIGQATDAISRLAEVRRQSDADREYQNNLTQYSAEVGEWIEEMESGADVDDLTDRYISEMGPRLTELSRGFQVSKEAQRMFEARAQGIFQQGRGVVFKTQIAREGERASAELKTNLAEIERSSAQFDTPAARAQAYERNNSVIDGYAAQLRITPAEADLAAAEANNVIDTNAAARRLARGESALLLAELRDGEYPHLRGGQQIRAYEQAETDLRGKNYSRYAELLMVNSGGLAALRGNIGRPASEGGITQTQFNQLSKVAEVTRKKERGEKVDEIQGKLIQDPDSMPDEKLEAMIEEKVLTRAEVNSIKLFREQRTRVEDAARQALQRDNEADWLAELLDDPNRWDEETLAAMASVDPEQGGVGQAGANRLVQKQRLAMAAYNEATASLQRGVEIYENGGSFSNTAEDKQAANDYLAFYAANAPEGLRNQDLPMGLEFEAVRGLIGDGGILPSDYVDSALGALHNPHTPNAIKYDIAKNLKGMSLTNPRVHRQLTGDERRNAVGNDTRLIDDIITQDLRLKDAPGLDDDMLKDQVVTAAIKDWQDRAGMTSQEIDDQLARAYQGMTPREFLHENLSLANDVPLPYQTGLVTNGPFGIFEPDFEELWDAAKDSPDGDLPDGFYSIVSDVFERESLSSPDVERNMILAVESALQVYGATRFGGTGGVIAVRPYPVEWEGFDPDVGLEWIEHDAYNLSIDAFRSAMPAGFDMERFAHMDPAMFFSDDDGAKTQFETFYESLEPDDIDDTIDKRGLIGKPLGKAVHGVQAAMLAITDAGDPDGITRKFFHMLHSMVKTGHYAGILDGVHVHDDASGKTMFDAAVDVNVMRPILRINASPMAHHVRSESGSVPRHIEIEFEGQTWWVPDGQGMMASVTFDRAKSPYLAEHNATRARKEEEDALVENYVTIMKSGMVNADPDDPVHQTLGSMENIPEHLYGFVARQLARDPEYARQFVRESGKVQEIERLRSIGQMPGMF